MTTDTATKYTGTVAWFSGNDRNYGFIQPDGGGPSTFVHISAVGHAGLKDLKQGDRLEYTIQIDERSSKACATNLRIIA